ncbi:MAG: ABC transporter permease subunit [Acidimicrobiales bacterium]
MTWRLQRSVYFFFVAATLVIIGLVITNGLHTQSLLHQWNGAPCHAGNGFSVKYQNYCNHLFQQFASSKSHDQFFVMMAVIPTAVLGLLLGANLVGAELDRKTVRVAWTQSISRRQWLTSKVIVSISSLVILAVPLCLTYTWWISTVKYAPRVTTTAFAYDGWLPLVTGIFAFALATFIGTLLRHPGWTIAATLIVMALVMWTMQNEVRPNLVPLHTAIVHTALTSKGPATALMYSNRTPQDSWTIFQGYAPLNSGNAVPTSAEENRLMLAMERCTPGQPNETVYVTCLQKLGLRSEQIYVADNEFWALQMREGGLYLLGTALLVGLSFLTIRRINV